MKNLVVIIILFISNALYGQKAQIYNPDADVQQDVAEAVHRASMKGRHVFLQIGGNWCSWCIKFHNFVGNDSELKSVVEKNYEVVKVNCNPDTKNEKLLASLGFPQRFGFPVFVILDGKGNRIHTQNSAFLEKGDAEYCVFSKTGRRMFWIRRTINNYRIRTIT